MPRYKLTIAYDGRPFCGWQKQATHPSVQACIEDAVFKFSGERTLVQGSGRTDTGVHASGQVAHLDLNKAHTPDTVQGALNHHVRPAPISIIDVAIVSDAFHARFNATRRAYLYRILNRRAPPAYRKGIVWHVPKPLNVKAMDAAAQYLLGHHDFTTFRDSQCQAKNPMRTIDSVQLFLQQDEIHMQVAARAFLHRQIRSFMGSLVEVGRGKHPPHWIRDILQATNRTLCGPVAPPDGLFLSSIQYDTAV